MEGAVMIEKDGEQHTRYCHLFNDHILVSKPRAGGMYTLKYRFKLSHCWLWAGAPMGEVSLARTGFSVWYLFFSTG